MNPVKALMYFILVNGMLNMFTIIGVFSIAATLGTNNWDLGFSLISNWGGVLLTGGAIGGAAVSYLSGINPLTGAAFGLFAGFFLDTFRNIWIVMTNIRDSPLVSDYSAIMNGFLLMIVAVFVISFLWTLIQMATGGQESFE